MEIFTCGECFHQWSGETDACPSCGTPYEVSTTLLEPGTLLQGNYKVGKCLGSGGFGITYLAMDNLDRKMVIKEYFPNELSSRMAKDKKSLIVIQKHQDVFQSGLKKFLKEAKLIAKLDHPNIVKIVSFFEENQTSYYVMPFIEGKALDEHLTAKGDRIEEKEALALLIPIFEGLYYLHEFEFEGSKGFIHRDIAPDNIYINSASGIPLLIDFGAARHSIGGETKSSFAVVKHGYAPPEQYSTISEQAPYTDIYAAGATLYRLLTGIVPAPSNDRNTRIFIDRQPDPIIPLSEQNMTMNLGLSSSVIQTVEKCLHLKPEDRPQSMKEVIDGLSSETGRNQQTEAPEQESATVVSAPVPPPDPTQRPALSRSQPQKTVIETGSYTAPEEKMERPVTVLPQKEEQTARKKSGIVPLVIAGTAVAAAILAVLWVLFGGPKYRLVVATVPDDTNIELLDHKGEFRQGMELAPGKYRIKIGKAGFKAQEKRVEIKDQDLLINVSLELMKFRLTVKTDPHDAQIRFLNSDLKFEQRMQLQPGKYRISVDKPGWHSMEQSFEITSSDLSLRFSISQKKYRLYVAASPSGSKIRLLGHKQPFSQNMLLPAGKYKLEVSKAGFHTKVESIEIIDEDLSVNIEMGVVNYRLTVIANPADVRISFVNSKRKFKQKIQLLPGKYKIRVSKPGWHSAEQSFEITNRNLALNVAIKQIQYRLNVTVNPSGSKVRLTNYKEPFGQNMLLPIGEYRIEASKKGYRTKSRTVTIRNSDVVTRVNLERDLPRNMVYIPAGTFSMGSSKGDRDEKPVHKVYTDAFFLDKYEVSVAEYKKCLNRGICKKPETGSYYNWGVRGRDNHPINGVSWRDAKSYCSSINKRMPTEAEWEKAATWRNGRKYIYASGKSKISCSQAVMDNRSGGKYTPGCGKKRTWPRGSKPKEINGTHDMVGNVLEWVNDRKGKYPSGLVRNPQGPGQGLYRAYRGGSWKNDSPFMRGTDRYAEGPSHRDYILGIRCASSVNN